jgi:hypothetical protein
VKFILLPTDATLTTQSPELASKNTSSALVGTEEPPAPPDVADQLAVAL